MLPCLLNQYKTWPLEVLEALRSHIGMPLAEDITHPAFNSNIAPVTHFLGSFTSFMLNIRVLYVISVLSVYFE